MNLKTGDIILFNEQPKCGSIFVFIDWAIRCWTGSPYSHAGLVIVDPPWTCGQQLRGTYIWDSSQHLHKDPTDDKIKFGIALVPIQEYLHDASQKHQRLYKRSPKDTTTYDLFTKEKLLEIHDKVYGKGYDTKIGHWLATMLHILVPRTDTTFFCSAFVSYALTTVGVLAENTDWTIVSPADLSSNGKNEDLHWRHGYTDDELFSEF